jgi:NADPH:quinone reductase
MSFSSDRLAGNVAAVRRNEGRARAMKAIVSKAAGGPETLTLEEVPSPRVGKHDVLIDVKAAAANYPDVLIIKDEYQFKPPRPFSPGGEFAGVIKAIGPEVTRFKVGDRVFGNSTHGGYAEEAVLNEFRAFGIPDGMSFEDAACLLMTYATSHHALKDRGHLKAGETLLVLGAAGGVGIAAVELGKAMGARVIAAASSQEKVEFAKQAGADEGIVYAEKLGDRDAQRAFSDKIKEIGGGGVDVIYDSVGGDYAEPAIRAMNWDGRYLVIGFPAGIPRIPLNLTLLKGMQIVGVFWGSFAAKEPRRHAANVQELFELYAAGKIKPRISQRFPLARAAEAIRVLQDRKVQGKIVVTMD